MADKILIVDDETMMTELLSDHLGDEGYETMTANSAWQTLSGKTTALCRGKRPFSPRD